MEGKNDEMPLSRSDHPSVSSNPDPRGDDLASSMHRQKEQILDAVQRYGATPDTSPDVVERLAEVDVAIDDLIGMALCGLRSEIE